VCAIPYTSFNMASVAVFSSFTRNSRLTRCFISTLCIFRALGEGSNDRHRHAANVPRRARRLPVATTSPVIQLPLHVIRSGLTIRVFLVSAGRSATHVSRRNRRFVSRQVSPERTIERDPTAQRLFFSRR